MVVQVHELDTKKVHYSITDVVNVEEKQEFYVVIYKNGETYRKSAIYKSSNYLTVHTNLSKHVCEVLKDFGTVQLIKEDNNYYVNSENGLERFFDDEESAFKYVEKLISSYY